MKVRKIISKSKNGNRMEVISEEGKTLHIHQRYDIWNYFVGLNEQKVKVYGEIQVGGK